MSHDWKDRIVTTERNHRPLGLLTWPWLILIWLLTTPREDIKFELFSNLSNDEKEEKEAQKYMLKF